MYAISARSVADGATPLLITPAAAALGAAAPGAAPADADVANGVAIAVALDEAARDPGTRRLPTSVATVRAGSSSFLTSML
ncbi:hypothetical protein GCM10010522_72270 [Kribbella solani]